jgi:crotonobetainyl-CoA:carnitine CoA-transferase CaiB-like acyl-CoA transferase
MHGEFCAKRTRAEVIDEIGSIGLSVEKVLTPAEMVDDPHIQARGTIQSVRQPSGATIRLEGPPVKMSPTPVRIRRAAPQHGLDTDQVLEAAGIDKTCRSELRKQGII